MIRHFPWLLGALLAGFLFARCQLPPSWADDGRIKLGVGDQIFAWRSDWLQWPEDRTLGNTHGGFAVDSDGRIYCSTDGEHAVLVLDQNGQLLDHWGAELAGGVHSICLTEEQGKEVLYLPHHAHGKVYKYNLDGQRIAAFGCPTESGHYPDPGRYKPTAVAVADDGSLWVADGYGMSWVHHLTADGEYLASIGGPGEAAGQFRTPHGLLWIGTGEDARLVVADRENHRLQFFRPDGSFDRLVDGIFRRPCSVDLRGDVLVVADLAGRVTLLTLEGSLICHLGDQPDPELRARNGIAPAKWRDGLFLAPHGASWDLDGSLLVQDWNANGRITRLQRLR